jgi:hypothetical protein
LLGGRDKWIEIVYGGEKIFCTGTTWAAKAGQRSLFVLAWQAQRTNQRRTLFLCTLGVPICPSFNSQQGPPLSSLSGTSPAGQSRHSPGSITESSDTVES